MKALRGGGDIIMADMRKLLTVLRYVPALTILCVSWYLSSQQSINDMPVSNVYRLFLDLPPDSVIESHLPGFIAIDKIVHCVCFAGFAFWTAFGIGLKPPPKVRLALPVALLAVYAVIDELHQSFTPSREISVGDWAADVTGAVIGSLVFFYLALLAGRVFRRG